MSNTDQHLVDYLFEQIFVQKLRCTHFNSITQHISKNSVWNRHTDENKIMDNMLQKYKSYYRDKAEKMKIKLLELKQYNTSSYLTYDSEYYINKYNAQVEQVNKYIVELDNKNINHITTEKLSYISQEINLLFPSITPDPTLLGLII
jgi:hypothetical protein